MRTLTIEQIEQLEHGTPIPRMALKINKVLDQKTGEGQYGVWHLQTLFCEDEASDAELAVTWTGEDPFEKSAEGVTYEFVSGQKPDGKLVGVARDIRQKDGKTYSGVKVTPAAKIRRVGKDEGAAVDEDWPDAEPAPAAAPVRADNPGNGGGVTEARKHLMQAANLYVLCIKCVNNVVAGELPEVAQTSDMFQAAVGTLFIEASRAGFVTKMPDKPL